MSMRAVSLEAGWGRDYLTQVLGGNQDIKLKHLLSVLDVLGVEPVVFWRRLAAPALSDSSGSEVREPPAVYGAQDDARPVSRAEVEDLLAEVLGKVSRVEAELERRGELPAEGKAPPRSRRGGGS